MFDEILDRLELILDDFLNLLLLEADPKILSSHDLSLLFDIYLSGVECKLLVSWILSLVVWYRIMSKKSSLSFLMHSAHIRSSLMVSLSTFRLIDQ